METLLPEMGRGLGHASAKCYDHVVVAHLETRQLLVDFACKIRTFG